MTDLAQEQDRLMGDVMTMLADHANIIDALKQQFKDMQGFMDWATTTHPTIFAEYNAVSDLADVASDGRVKLNKMIDEWTTE
jgi:hypothetical protein